MSTAEVLPFPGNQAAPPKTFLPILRVSRYGRDVWKFGPEANKYSDDQLLRHIGVAPELGGLVERHADGTVIATAFTD